MVRINEVVLKQVELARAIHSMLECLEKMRLLGISICIEKHAAIGSSVLSLNVHQ